MTLRVYNTLTRQKEPFETIQPGKVSMYVCGPTVYSNAHVGHAMSVLVFDIIRRYLEFRGYQVTHVMNYTDVDDKIIQRAAQQNIEPLSLAEKYIQEFDQHLEDFNILPADIKPRATHEMDQIIQMVTGLIETGYAYSVEGDVYFRVDRDKSYGKLSGRKLEDMQAGARIQVDERKENPMDFALWKSAKPGEPAWESPWGKGRPGWHIECSAMNLHHLGPQIDIHGGGSDLIFPHHENEIAQSESLTGKPFARYWVHNGMLQFSGEKMSKSLGNLITIEAFLADHHPDVLRMMVLNSLYRNPLTFNQDVITQAEHSLERLRSALRPAQSQASTADQTILAQLEAQQQASHDGFIQAMDDDFNTPRAMGHLFELVRVINQARDAGADQQALRPAQSMLLELSSLLGLRLEYSVHQSSPADAFIDLLLEVRVEMRKQKNWALSDHIRDQLLALGVAVEDTQQGSSWRWVE